MVNLMNGIELLLNLEALIQEVRTKGYFIWFITMRPEVLEKLNKEIKPSYDTFASGGTGLTYYTYQMLFGLRVMPNKDQKVDILINCEKEHILKIFGLKSK